MGVWGAIANKMGASQETFLWVKITQASFQIIKWYVPKKASYMIYLKAVCSESIWGSGATATFQRIR